MAVNPPFCREKISPGLEPFPALGYLIGVMTKERKGGGRMGLTREDFTQAVLAYQRDMYRAARAMLPCDADAEDAVSQAVLLAWQSRDRLREEDAARAWLVKITVNCARQQCRHRGRVLYLSELEPLAGGREDPRPHELWDAVLSLPPEQRTAVVLFYYEDLSLREIARTLRVPEGTVKSRLSRGRERLRTLLSEEISEKEDMT